MDWLVPWLVFLHVLGAIVAFGPSFAFPLIGAMGGREPQHANFGIRVSNTIAHRLTFPIGITLPITGALIILIRGIDLADRAFWWLGIAIVLYVIAYGYAFFFQRRYIARVIEMSSAPPPPGAAGPPPQMRALITRIQRGGAGLLVLIVTIVALMVLKPQF